jgi:hypothetical protein
VAPDPKTTDELWIALRERLQEPGYQRYYDTESRFEVDVWKRVVKLAEDLGLDAAHACLSSHVIHAGRSAAAWKQFLRESVGPDVKVLDSNNRLDIVLRHPAHGSIGIEVKCLGQTRHAGKLTQALGQALLGLAHRERTLVVIHCGTVGPRERKLLQETGDKICAGAKLSLVVVS